MNVTGLALLSEQNAHVNELGNYKQQITDGNIPSITFGALVKYFGAIVKIKFGALDSVLGARAGILYKLDWNTANTIADILVKSHIEK